MNWAGQCMCLFTVWLPRWTKMQNWMTHTLQQGRADEGGKSALWIFIFRLFFIEKPKGKKETLYPGQDNTKLDKSVFFCDPSQNLKEERKMTPED